MITRRDLLKGAAYVTAGAAAGVAVGKTPKAVVAQEPSECGFGFAPIKAEGQAVEYDPQVYRRWVTSEDLENGKWDEVDYQVLLTGTVPADHDLVLISFKQTGLVPPPGVIYKDFE
jgi:hypothetical protein